MPQGVEHIGWLTDTYILARGVPKPLMPQGVEHRNNQSIPIFDTKVPKPLMPQGVEHVILLAEKEYDYDLFLNL